MTLSRRLPLALLLPVSGLLAQPGRFARPIDPARTAPLTGNLRPAMLRRNDQGRVEADFPLPAMTIPLKPSPGGAA